MESSVEPETLSEAVVIYLFAAAEVLMVLLRVWDGPKIALADRTHFHILRIFGGLIIDLCGCGVGVVV